MRLLHIYRESNVNSVKFWDKWLDLGGLLFLEMRQEMRQVFLLVIEKEGLTSRRDASIFSQGYDIPTLKSLV